MSFQVPNYLIAMPEIFVLAMACLTLLGELFLGKKHNNLSYYGVQLTLVVVTFLTLLQLGDFRSLTFNGLYVADDISTLLKVAIYVSSMIAFYYSKQYVHERDVPFAEYYILGLFSILGMMVLVSAHSLLTIYLGLEVLSLPLYAMIALRRDSGTASEAAMKYFVMGAIASGMLLYGMSMLFGATASLDLSAIAQHIAKVWPSHNMMISFGLVFILAGICFKLAAVPFHLWAPDVYEGSSSSVTLFLSSAPKVAAMGMAIRLLVFALPGTFDQWQSILIVVALLSTIIGNLLAVVQTNVKRLLAYSGIAHIGYALFGLIAGTSEGYSAALFYMLVYALMSVGAFGLIVLMSTAGYESCDIEDFRGLNARHPWLAFMMLIIMFSMAGVPPMIGFFTKFLVLKALVDVQLTWLALIGLLFAVVGAYYYLRIIKTMYFEAPAEEGHTFTVSNGMQAVFTFNALALLALGLFPNALMQACLSAFAFSG